MQRRMALSNDAERTGTSSTTVHLTLQFRLADLQT